MSDLIDRLRYRTGNPSAWPEGYDEAGSELMRSAVNALEARDKTIAELVELTRDLSDCLDDMTKHYVEVRNDLYGFEAARLPPSAFPLLIGTVGE